MLKENELMIAALVAEMTPAEYTDMDSWQNEGELRKWCAFFEADPTRAEVLTACLKEQQELSEFGFVNWSRVWVMDEIVDTIIQKVFAFTEVPVPMPTFREWVEEE